MTLSRLLLTCLLEAVILTVILSETKLAKGNATPTEQAVVVIPMSTGSFASSGSCFSWRQKFVTNVHDTAVSARGGVFGKCQLTLSNMVPRCNEIQDSTSLKLLLKVKVGGAVKKTKLDRFTAALVGAKYKEKQNEAIALRIYVSQDTWSEQRGKKLTAKLQTSISEVGIKIELDQLTWIAYKRVVPKITVGLPFKSTPPGMLKDSSELTFQMIEVPIAAVPVFTPFHYLLSFDTFGTLTTLTLSDERHHSQIQKYIALNIREDVKTGRVRAFLTVEDKSSPNPFGNLGWKTAARLVPSPNMDIQSGFGEFIVIKQNRNFAQVPMWSLVVPEARSPEQDNTEKKLTAALRRKSKVSSQLTRAVRKSKDITTIVFDFATLTASEFRRELPSPSRDAPECGLSGEPTAVDSNNGINGISVIGRAMGGVDERSQTEAMDSSSSTSSHEPKLLNSWIEVLHDLSASDVQVWIVAPSGATTEKISLSAGRASEFDSNSNILLHGPNHDDASGLEALGNPDFNPKAIDVLSMGARGRYQKCAATNLGEHLKRIIAIQSGLVMNTSEIVVITNDRGFVEVARKLGMRAASPSSIV